MAPEKDKNTFTKFYKQIKNKKYTTAMLQEFLFYNRNKDTIYPIINQFFNSNNRIIEKNKSDLYL